MPMLSSSLCMKYMLLLTASQVWPCFMYSLLVHVCFLFSLSSCLPSTYCDWLVSRLPSVFMFLQSCLNVITSRCALSKCKKFKKWILKILQIFHFKNLCWQIGTEYEESSRRRPPSQIRKFKTAKSESREPQRQQDEEKPKSR
jgi:hypothetical protein